MGVAGILANSGSTSAFHGPWKGLPSTKRVCKDERRQSQLGRLSILLRRTLRVCNLSSSLNVSGRVLIPVESAIRTRSDVKWDKNTGRTRSGFDAMFNSSRQWHEASAGGTATRKLADMSRASKVLQIIGSVLAKKAGIAFGVLDDPTSMCVVPKQCRAFSRQMHRRFAQMVILTGFHLQLHNRYAVASNNQPTALLDHLHS